MKIKWGIFFCLFLFVIGAYQLEKIPFFDKLKNTLQDQSVPGGILNYGAMGKVLKKSGLVKATPKENLYFPDTDNSLIRIQLESDTDTRLQIYWATNDQAYLKNRTSSTPVFAGQREYVLFAPAFDKIRKLRLDPAMESARIRISKIIIERSNDIPPLVLTASTGLEKLKPISGVSDLSYDSKGVSFRSINSDPQLELDLSSFKKLEKLAFLRKRQETRYQFTANLSGFKTYSSSNVITKEYFKENWPIVSIVAEDDDLYHPDRGIIANKDSRGRYWERPASFSYFDGQGKLLFASMVGLRIHGGLRIQLYNSFRLYFRKEYGASQFPEFKPIIQLDSKANEIERLVVHHTAWPPNGWFFNNTMAYDIARQIGCVVPETKLALLFINGVEKGIYFLAPQINEKLISEYLGHENFVQYKFKSNNSPESRAFYTKYFWYADSETRKKLTMAETGDYIDLDNLTRHLFSFIFSGTSDYCQGTVVHDKSESGKKVFWINWDMDHSFIDDSGIADRPIWEQKSWSLAYRPPPYRCVRSRIFSRLINEDEEFRKFVISLSTDLLNHRINPKFFQSRLQYYNDMLSSYGNENSDYMRQLEIFLKNRPAFIRSEMQKLFDIGPSRLCRVKGPAGIEYLIDGYPESADYQGYYFANNPVKISITSDHKENFSHWLVNGSKNTEYPLVHKVNSKTIIEPVFNNDA